MVDEVPSLPTDIQTQPKSFPYTIIQVEKSNFTTFEVIDILAVNLGISRDYINCLGLKDEDGITKQYMSVKKTLQQSDLDQLNKLHPSKDRYIRFRLHGYSKKALEEKKLHGNIFGVTLRGLTESEANKLFKSISNNSEHIFVNYYDQQRFGLPGGPFVSQKIGEAIVKDDKEKALKFYIESGNAKIDGYNKDSITNDIFSKLNPKKIDFFISAYTSYLWNEIVAQSLASIKNTKMVDIFDGYRLPVLQNYKTAVTPFINIQGYKYSKATGVETYMKTRQSLIGTKVYVGNANTDELNRGKFKLQLDFFLPTGCYATMAVKQLLINRV